jgi:hypothetical protein
VTTRLRQGLLVLLAATVALGLVAAPPVAREVAAATPDLTLVSNARYDVQPEERRVRVTVDILATNRLRDTATRRFYFDRAFLAVPPGTTGFRITSSNGDPSVRVSQRRAGYQILALSFGQRIFSQRAARFRLTFDMPDPGGAPTRDVRVGTALVSFPVWAYASEDTPGSNVTVVFPEGYNVQLEAGKMNGPTTDGGAMVFTSGRLDDPLGFFAYFVADRPGSYAESTVETRIGDRDAELTIRAWPDDPEWTERVSDLMARGLPEIQKLVGLPWAHEEPLIVQESVSRTTGGYAGLFDPADGRVEVAYYADPFVILHEAAHAWFNGGLLADRWANEAFASYYAQSAGGRLEQEIAVGELTDELREAAFPLNAWAPAGRGDPTAEDYGYAAAVTLAREIARRAGHDGLRRVWAAAAGREAAYQPPAVDPGTSRPPETADAPPDWRGLLDLLEEHTGEEFSDLWREWVVRDGEAALLDERAAAREAYEQTVRAAGRWELPAAVRASLRAWQFETATQLLEQADGVLARRAELETAAREAGLRLPARLETAFESDAGFEAAIAEADAEALAIEIVADAGAAEPASADPLQQLGLIGEDPDGRMAAAREAFAQGELQRAAEEASTAQAIWQRAGEMGRNRLLIGIGFALLAGLAILLLVSWLRDRRRRTREGTAPASIEEPSAGDSAAG